MIRMSDSGLYDKHMASEIYEEAVLRPVLYTLVKTTCWMFFSIVCAYFHNKCPAMSLFCIPKYTSVVYCIILILFHESLNV